MTTDDPLIITISRQLGSGGSFIGQKLSERLGLAYIDRQIIIETAKKLQLFESEIESRSERRSTFFESLFQELSIHPAGMYYIPPEMYIPSDMTIYKAEAEIIEKISKNQPAVIIGRGSAHVLRKHPGHFSIFIHADKAFRCRRIQTLYELSPAKAEAAIEKYDKDRAEYNKTISGKHWLDVRRYHLAIDTGMVDFDDAVELVVTCVRKRFGDNPKIRS